VIPVRRAAQVRGLDAAVIGEVGVPGAALMEIAARGVADAIRAHHAAEAARGVVVVCGSGNNGGDGYAIARWLKGWGFPVRTWSVAKESRGDAEIMRTAAVRLGIAHAPHVRGAGLIVDALLGTGLDREVKGELAAVITAMNAEGAPIVAVDVPSGLHADTGAVLGVAVNAVRTVTFGAWKPGLLCTDRAGVVDVVDIGLDAAVSDDPAGAAFAELPEAADLAPAWPRRAPGDHKTRSGHLLVVAGSRAMAGAAILACRGALSAGVGLVTLVAPHGALPRLAALPPEVMLIVAGDDHVRAVPDGVLDGKTALAAGPGLGGGTGVPADLGAWLRKAWGMCDRPVVFDADALPFADGPAPAGRIVTPHPGEAGRMLGIDAAAVQSNRFGAVRKLASGRVALLKGRYTLVDDGEAPISVNPTNSAVLGTGGSGDVLLGVIGGLLARGVGARDAARLGAYVHGRAGERLEARRKEGWTASDIVGEIPDAVAELTSA
jgi:hydroxyethylthiazole kinase-like uncharacterized protein yjeF